MRDIAREAGVDPGMVYHYFGGKEGLFLESLRSSFEPLRPRGPAGSSPADDLGERIVERFLDLWDADGNGNPFVGILRACATSERAASALRMFASETVVPAVREDLGAEAEVRTALVGGQLLGLALVRYLLRLDGVASMGHRELAELAGPNVTSTLLAPASRVPRAAPKKGGPRRRAPHPPPPDRRTARRARGPLRSRWADGAAARAGHGA